MKSAAIGVTLLCVALCSCSRGKPDAPPLQDTTKKTVAVPVSPPDTCTALPVFKKVLHDDPDHDVYYEEVTVLAAAGDTQSLLQHRTYDLSADCNSEGLELGDYEFRNDTLTFYTYWCHAGDPTGHEWGARIASYHWNCRSKTFTKIDARLYVEIQGEMGSDPLERGATDSTAIADRELYKYKCGQQYKARFVVGQEAYDLRMRARTFLAKKISAATASWESIYGVDGFSFGYRL